MFNNKTTNFHYQRLRKLYEREIAFALQNLIKKDYLSSCSITDSSLSTKGENLKVYLLFTKPETSKKSLFLLNKDYLFLIKKHLFSCKKFSRIPQISFYLDEKDEKLARIEKIIKEN